jgi:hypothetical protein
MSFFSCFFCGCAVLRQKIDGEGEHEAVPAELLHHEGERAAAQGGQAAQPGEPGPALRAQATPRQVGRRQQQCAGGEPRVQGRP